MCFRLLIAHSADVNSHSSSGNTPLMYACAGGHEDVSYPFLYAVLWIRIHFFRIRIQNFFSNLDPYTNILTRNFLKWCVSLLSYTVPMFWNLYDREKGFPPEKHMFMLFELFDMRLFTFLFLFYNSLGFGFGSSQNIRILSDSDPQHCLYLIPYLHFYRQEWIGWQTRARLAVYLKKKCRYRIRFSRPF
jgi:ankyrin repeat protein